MQRKVDVLTAALLNCVSSGAHAFDDTHAEMVLHPAGPIAASIMALAERTPVKGEDFLLALVLGLEVECRLTRAIAVPPAQCDVGWYLTGLTGGIGAAAAAGKLMGLSAEQIVWACGIACGQGSGFRAMHGSMCSPLVPAHAGHTGLRAAFMAAKGYTSTSHHVDGDRGFLEMYAQKANPAAVTDRLGSQFEVMRNTYKPYPCGIVLHPLIDGCLQVAAQSGAPAAAIERVEVKVHPLVMVISRSGSTSID
jgi:2-methylcitrate dehydratase PrpD